MRPRASVPTGTARHYRRKAFEMFDDRCQRCGVHLDWDDTEVHHADQDHLNDNLDNLEILCRGCHSEEHSNDRPLTGLLVDLPLPMVDLLDVVVEEGGMASRSEAVARAIAEAYGDTGVRTGFCQPHDSVSAWYDDPMHERMVRDRVVEPKAGQG